jgi:ACS family hexuronate transporter-like MFS transporter
VIPAGLKAVAEWFPDRERSVGFGWVNAGTSLGGMIAPPLVIGCILVGSWQIAFVITEFIGLVWALAWFLFYRTPGPST